MSSSHAILREVPPRESRPGPIARRRLRFEGPAPDSLELAELWEDLVRGRLFLADACYAGDRAFATLALAPRTSTSPIDRADGDLLARALLGERPKTLAWEIGVVPSRIATRCTNALLALGRERQLPHVSLLLVAAAHAARGLSLPPARVEGVPNASGASQWVVSIDNPARSLEPHLSPSEYTVARLAVEGKTYAAIAVERGTSERTVANQLASTFRKLHVSGRCELRARAVRDHASVEG